MDLKTQLNEDLKTALRAKDENRVGTIRLLKDAIAKFELTRPADKPASEAELIGVVEKQIKQRREAAELYAQGNRLELAAQERAEIAVLETYMPKQLTREEIAAEVSAIIAALGTREFPKVMRQAAATLKGRADGKLVNEVVKELTA